MRGSLVWDCTTNITNNLLKYTELNIYKKINNNELLLCFCLYILKNFVVTCINFKYKIIVKNKILLTQLNFCFWVLEFRSVWSVWWSMISFMIILYINYIYDVDDRFDDLFNLCFIKWDFVCLEQPEIIEMMIVTEWH